MEHGLSKTRLYNIYSGMKQRCYNPNNQHYQWYGAKGITICDEWLGDNGLQNFFDWSLSHGYDENLTIYENPFVMALSAPYRACTALFDKIIIYTSKM